MAEPFVDPNDDTNLYWLMAYAEDVERSKSDPEVAAKLLVEAADHLERGEVVPKPLAEFIATAFRKTARVGQRERPAWLAQSLNLSTPNRRSKVSENELGGWVFRHSMENRDKSETFMLNAAVKHFKISKTTATTHWRAWKQKDENIKPAELLAMARKSNLKG